MSEDTLDTLALAAFAITFFGTAGAMTAHLVLYLLGHTGRMGPLWWVALVGLLAYNVCLSVLSYTEP